MAGSTRIATGAASSGNTAGAMPKPCPHAVVFTEDEDLALRWLHELFDAIEHRDSLSARMAINARSAIRKLWEHVHAQHETIHALEAVVDEVGDTLDGVARGELFISKGGEA